MGLFDELLSQPGVTATGGGIGYDPNEDYWEIRFDTEGNAYNSKPHVPLHPGHTKEKQPMFDIPKVDVPTPPSLLNYGDEYYYQDYVQPQTQYDVNPTQEQSLGTPTDQTTQFDNRTIFQTDDGRLQSEQSVSVTIDGKVYTAPSIQPQINPNRPLTWQEVSDGIINGTIQPTSIHEGPTAIEDANNQAQIRSDSINVNPMSLYNRQGRADYTPQTTYNPETIFGDPSLGSLPNPTQDAYAEEQWYTDESAREDARHMEVLQQASERREEEKRQAQIEAKLQELLKMQGMTNPREALMQDVGYPTTGPMSPNTSPDTLESLQQAQTQHRQDWADTDAFGTPLSTDDFGQTNYEQGVDQRLNSMNQMAFSGNAPVVAPTDNKPNYPSHLTPYAIKMLEEQRKRNEMFQGIGDTAVDMYEGAKTLGSDAIQGAQDLYQDFTKPDVVVEPTPTSADDLNLFDILGETDELVKKDDKKPDLSHLTPWAREQIESQNARNEFFQGVGDTASDVWDGTVGGIAKNWYGNLSKDAEGEKQKYSGDEAIVGLMRQNFGQNFAEIVKGGVDAAISPVETADAIASLVSGAVQHGLPDDMAWNDESKKMASAVADIYAERYGSLEGFKKALAENPAEVLLELTGAGLITKAGVVKLTQKIKGNPDFIRDLNLGATIDNSKDKLTAIATGGIMKKSPDKVEMFAGVKAINPPKGLEQAKKMLDNEGGKYSNVLEKKIWTATGWHQLPDGNWAFEISDKKLSFKNLDDAEDVIMGSGVMPKTGGFLAEFTNGQLFKHDDLFKQYPEIADWGVDIKLGRTHADGSAYNPNTGSRGSFNPITKRITLYVDPVKGLTESTKSVWLHETQHGVQLLENWMSGGTSGEGFQALLMDVLRKEQRPFSKDKRKYDKHAFQYEYANKLEQRDYWKNFANSDNLTGKARHIYNNQLWYEHSTEIRKLYGAPPKKHKIAEHNEYLRKVAKFYEDEYSDSLWKIKEGTKYSDRGSIDSEWMLEVDNMTVKNKTASIERKMSKNLTNVQEYNRITKLIDEINSPDADRASIYKRLQGEWQSRNTQDRSGLGDKGREWAAPFETADTYNTEIIYTKTPERLHGIVEGMESGRLPWNMTSKGDGDFYIQRVGPNAGKVSKTRNGPSDIAFSTDKGALDSDYAYYAVMSLEKQLQSRAHGTAQQAINMTDVDAVLTDLFQNMNKVDSKVDDGVLGQFGKATDPMNFKTADEFIKAQGTTVYHGGTKIDEIGNISDDWGAFYMSDNPTYAKSFGGNKSVVNEVVLDDSANLVDMRKPSAKLVSEIKSRLKKDNAVFTDSQIVQGIKDGKAHFSELPEVKAILKDLGYDGQITSEVPWAKNIGVWNKNVIKTKQQLTDTWNKAHKVDDGEGLLKIKKKVTKPKNGLLD